MEHNNWNNSYGSEIYNDGENGEHGDMKEGLDMNVGQRDNEDRGFSEHESFLLSQLESNIYVHATRNSGNDIQDGRDSNLEHENDFQIDNVNFVLSDSMNFENKSSAYPPMAHGEVTPSLGPSNLKQISEEHEQAFVSPILPGQNEKSYNNQHYYHKYGKHMTPDTFAHQPRNLHIRPDAVFTPLVSPAVTPIESQINLNKSQYNAPVQATFEPLTSPALNAQKHDRRRSSSSLYAPKEASQVTIKRKTPHGTPILQASRGTKSRNSNKNSADANSRPSEPEISGELLNHENIDLSNIGPTVSMGFTMGMLEQSRKEDFDPYIQSTTNEQIERKQSTKSASSSENSPTFSLQNSGGSHSTFSSTTNVKPKSEKPATKKASHKLAEQGRRNRMNMAVKELSGLIPQSYHDKILIPSKATTVELASQYIRDLVNELGNSKQS